MADQTPTQGVPNSVTSTNAPSEALNEKTHAESLPSNSQVSSTEKQDPEPESEKSHQADKKDSEKKDDGGGEDQPAGGFDSTPIPRAANGYTLKFTFHRASNLPAADLNSQSSDPFILAQLNAHTPLRHKEDSPLRYRTHTVQKNCSPEWNEEWIVANVPSSGFKLKVRIYDEDPADHDDRLGDVHITEHSLNENWRGMKEQRFSVMKRKGSKRAYAARFVFSCFGAKKSLSGDLFVSIEMLGRTQDDGQNGRMYTVGPLRWFKHYSPMLGRLTNTKEPDSEEAKRKAAAQSSEEQKKIEKYNFQANQLQLAGPVPPQLYHRFVEFKPFVKRMFTGSGFGGVLMGKALHHQHARVYSFGRSTEWGNFGEKPSEDMTKHFLEMVHYDEGGRIFTYVLTLDSLWRFTETGKEFGIDMLSKHTMHSDVSIYIAFSGEFFIRRLKHPRRPPPPDPTEDAAYVDAPEHGDNPTHPDDDISGGPPNDDPPKDPSYYELVIDNDSGTYRPNAQLLPQLKDYLAHALPGLHILTLDCQKDADRMGKMKDQQRERKKKEGDRIVYTQGSRAGSISSSDEEDLDRIQAGIGGETSRHEHGALKQAAIDAKLENHAKWEKTKRNYGGHAKPGGGSA